MPVRGSSNAARSTTTAGTVAGRRLRGSTGTADKARAERIAATKEAEHWKHHLDGPAAVLTFAKARRSCTDRPANKRSIFNKIEDYWKDILVKDIAVGAIKQMAIDIYSWTLPRRPATGRPSRRARPSSTTAPSWICAPRSGSSAVSMRRRSRCRSWSTDRRLLGPPPGRSSRPWRCRCSPPRSGSTRRCGRSGRIMISRRGTILVRDTSRTRANALPTCQSGLLVALSYLSRDDRPFPYSESSLRRFWDEDVERTARVPCPASSATRSTLAGTGLRQRCCVTSGSTPRRRPGSADGMTSRCL